MNVTVVAAWTASILLSGLALFQLALAAGAPLGRFAWGGTHPGVLPGRLRLASLLAAAIVTTFPLFVLERAEVIPGLGRPAIASAAIWALTALFALSTIGNLASTSASERRIMTPVALLLTICCLIVAL